LFLKNQKSYKTLASTFLSVWPAMSGWPPAPRPCRTKASQEGNIKYRNAANYSTPTAIV